MKKVNLGTRDVNQVYLDELRVCDHVGFVIRDGDKGYIVYVGDGSPGNAKISAVSSQSLDGHICNISYGEFRKNSFQSVEEALDFSARGMSSCVEEVFIFDTRKELYRWLSED